MELHTDGNCEVLTGAMKTVDSSIKESMETIFVEFIIIFFTGLVNSINLSRHSKVKTFFNYSQTETKFAHGPRNFLFANIETNCLALVLNGLRVGKYFAGNSKLPMHNLGDIVGKFGKKNTLL